MPPLWRQIQQKSLHSLDKLLEFVELKPQPSLLFKPRFPLYLPLRLAQKIEKGRWDDPILRQFLPLQDEERPREGFVLDPVGDTACAKSEKLLHKYNSRALLLVSSACAMHCRYCFRKNFPYETDRRSFEPELALIKQDPSLKEIILSGGDPLSLSDESLGELLSALDCIDHIKRIRFHTRFPIGIPERIDTSFLSLLKNCSKQIVFVLHTNHSRELDADILDALKKIHTLGIPLLNQTVLLKGVNDDVATLATLFETLSDNGILPYYLHQLDRVFGASHFEVAEEKGIHLMKELSTLLSGYSLPRYVREEAGKPSKTPILPH